MFGSYNKTDAAWCLLKLTYGVLFIVAGADKFLNLVTVWPKYISPLILMHAPLALETLVSAVGIIEILIGLTILTCSTMWGAYAAALWLLLIALNLLTMGMELFVDIAVRDIVMAMGAIALAWLSCAKCETKQSGTR